ncbi:MAG: hypothetical protein HQL51_16915, partial [Magnetococcales bacterium]|nr:hypothetical protein [Magnetococcales bacterium]
MFTTSGLHVDQAPPLSIPMRFFGSAPLFMILGGMALAGWGAALLGYPLLGETVATVHLATLGWIAMVMFGAMYQMIPVLAGVPVPWLGLAPWVHGLMVAGVISLFVSIGMNGHRWFYITASLGLGGGVMLFLVPIAVALSQAPSRHPTVWAMRLAALCLLITLGFGAIFLGEYAHGFLPLDREAMVGSHL